MKIFAILAFCLLTLVTRLPAQQDIRGFHGLYGLDPLLYNGRAYSYIKPANVKGSQYLFENGFTRGTVEIDTVLYKEVLVNYDIFNQLLVIQYTNPGGGVNVLSESDAWLKRFRIAGCNFELVKLDDSTKRIFQTIGSGGYRILYYWRKNINLNNPSAFTGLDFGNPQRQTFIQFQNRVKPYTFNRSFIRLFEPTLRNRVREYLRSNRIRVRNASDETMKHLIDFCNTLATDD